jgi:hypothetical protein
MEMRVSEAYGVGVWREREINEKIYKYKLTTANKQF